MKFRILLFTTLASSVATMALAQETEKSILPAKFSYFTGGFALLFIAVFLFSFCFKMVRNLKTRKESIKQMMNHSLRLAFIIALLMIIVLYFFLSNGQ